VLAPIPRQFHHGMDKLQPTGQNLCQVFNLKVAILNAVHLWCYQVKLPNFKFKTRPKQLVSSFLLDIALPDNGFALYFSIFGIESHVELLSVVKQEIIKTIKSRVRCFDPKPGQTLHNFQSESLKFCSLSSMQNG